MTEEECWKWTDYACEDVLEWEVKLVKAKVSGKIDLIRFYQDEYAKAYARYSYYFEKAYRMEKEAPAV